MDTTDLWMDIFLRELRVHGLINTAATTAGVTRRRVEREAEKNPEFEYAMESALEAAADTLELEARRRAVEGVVKGVYYQGDRVDEETVYSDTLLTTLLKAKRADEFAERKQITGAGGKPLTVVVRSFGPSPSGNPPVDGEFTRVEPATIEPAVLGHAPQCSSTELADIYDLV